MSAAPPLPLAVSDIQVAFSAVEDGIRNDEWELAGEEVQSMRTLLEQARPQLREAASVPGQRALIREFGAKLDQFGSAVEAQDRELSQVLMVALLEPSLELIELFDYDHHPALLAINLEMLERLEALEAGEFDAREYADEAEVLEEMYAAIAGFLLTRSVPRERLDAAAAVVADLTGAVERSDVAAVADSLRRLIAANASIIADQ